MKNDLKEDKGTQNKYIAGNVGRWKTSGKHRGSKSELTRQVKLNKNHMRQQTYLLVKRTGNITKTKMETKTV